MSDRVLPMLREKPKRKMGRPPRTVADRQLMVALGRRLKWVREALGKSQAEMAEIVGVHQTMWSLYERGMRWPDEFRAVQIMAKLQVSRAYLLEESLEGVRPELAIRLAAQHPHLAGTICTENRTDSGVGTGR